MKKEKSAQASMGGGFMSKKKKQSNKQPQSEAEKRVGYGDKKLEGPDRPST
jgi:hypothetical protein